MTTSREPPRPDVLAALDRVDGLVRLFEEHPDENVQERVFELLRSVDALHRAPLQRLRDFLGDHGLLASALADPDVALLFDLYNAEESDEGEEEPRGELEPTGEATRSAALIPVSMVIRQTHLEREARRQVGESP